MIGEGSLPAARDMVNFVRHVHIEHVNSIQLSREVNVVQVNELEPDTTEVKGEVLRGLDIARVAIGEGRVHNEPVLVVFLHNVEVVRDRLSEFSGLNHSGLVFLSKIGQHFIFFKILLYSP